jgi:electron transfer flavoprotein beta subunit
MNIVVCMKQVPDTGSERTLRPSDSTVDRDAASTRSRKGCAWPRPTAVR